MLKIVGRRVKERALSAGLPTRMSLRPKVSWPNWIAGQETLGRTHEFDRRSPVFCLPQRIRRSFRGTSGPFRPSNKPTIVEPCPPRRHEPHG